MDIAPLHHTDRQAVLLPPPQVADIHELDSQHLQRRQHALGAGIPRRRDFRELIVCDLALVDSDHLLQEGDPLHHGRC